MPTTSSPASPSLWKGLFSSPWLRPLNDPVALDDLLALIRPTWSLTAIKARVVDAIRETADVRTLVLEPNSLWPGHRAGQHVLVDVEIDGRRSRRTFTLSSPRRADGLLTITVKRREGGKVSAWWNDDAVVGDVVVLSRPMGDFVLPSVLPRRVVMLTAGSGITPAMAMLRELEGAAAQCEVLFVHCAPSRREVIFVRDLEAMARRQRWLHLQMHFTNASTRLDADAMSNLAVEAGDAPTFVCGPEGFHEAARLAWREAGREHNLRFEQFTLPPRRCDNSGPETIEAARSGKRFVVAGGQSLLDAAEAAGLRPAAGCRMGICHTCKCRKVSGVVEDLRDGRLSSEPDEMIQLCVTTARSPVTLEL